MTALGKILIFVNLVFSLLTAGLIGMVFFTRTNWKQAYELQTATLTVAQKVAQSDADRSSKFLEEQKNIVKQKDREIAERDKQVQTARAETDAVKVQLTESNKAKDQETAQVKTVTAEMERRQAEVKQHAGLLAARDTRVVDLEKQLTKTRDDSVQYKLSYDQLKERFAALLTQHEEASRELGQLRARGISAPPRTAVPPPESARGTIARIDGNLAEISIGTDAGVNKDHVLQVYRLTPTAEYLGTITITSATEFKAVGRLNPAGRRVTIKVGDEVASKITGQ